MYVYHLQHQTKEGKSNRHPITSHTSARKSILVVDRPVRVQYKLQRNVAVSGLGTQIPPCIDVRLRELAQLGGIPTPLQARPSTAHRHVNHATRATHTATKGAGALIGMGVGHKDETDIVVFKERVKRIAQMQADNIVARLAHLRRVHGAVEGHHDPRRCAAVH